MKSLCWGVLVVAALCGCSQPKSTELEKRVQELEAKVTRLKADFRESLDLQLTNSMEMASNYRDLHLASSNVAVLWEERFRTEVAWMEGEAARVREIAADELERQLQSRAAQFKAGRPAGPAPALGVRGAEPLREGVPVSVYNQIATDVAKRYPTDFSMQKILIADQVESYLKLHPAK